MNEFKYRMHDPAIGRFWQVDPLAEDYIYNGVYNFAENKVIDHYELEGLEGVQIHSYDKEGNLTGITYKLDVYVATGTTGDYNSNFSSSDLTDVQDALDLNFNNKTFTDPDTGVEVSFEMNAKPLFMQEVKTDSKGKKSLEKKEMNSNNVGREAFKRGTKADDGTTSLPALVFGQKVPGTDGGRTGIGVKVDKNSPEGFTNALGHELLHFMLDRHKSDDHNLKGGLGRPMTSPFVNDNILTALKTYVPRASQKDKKL